MVPAIGKDRGEEYVPNDYVCCEFLGVDELASLNLGMRGGQSRLDDGPPFGLILPKQFPAFYQ